MTNKNVNINEILKNIGRGPAYVLIEKDDGTLIIADSEKELERVQKKYLKENEVITAFSMQ